MDSIRRNTRKKLQALILCFDLIAIFLSFSLAHIIRFHNFKLSFIFTETFIFITLMILICNYVFNLYETKHWRAPLFSISRILISSVTSFLIILAITYLGTPFYRTGILGRGFFIGAFLLYVICSLIIRNRFQKFIFKLEKKNHWLFIGSPESFQKLNVEFEHSQFKGQIEWINTQTTIEQKHLSFFNQQWNTIIVDSSYPSSLEVPLMNSRLQGNIILSLSRASELLWEKIPLYSIDNNWFSFSEGFSLFHSRFQGKIKRLMDLGFALPLLLLLSPVIIIVAILIKMESHGPVFYKQTRVGQGGRLFTIWKFRSMSVNAEQDGAQWAQSNDQRVTKIGKFMRVTRVDEIPQLINILKSEMSFIGPRPERPEFTSKLKEQIPFYDLRHLVKPGLTGWAQIMYPYGASIEDAIQKLQYELYYIKNYSLALDFKIFISTISIVLFGKGR